VPYRSVNPATGEVLKTFPEHTNEQMWNALAKADKAFPAWAARPFSERSKIIGRCAQVTIPMSAFRSCLSEALSAPGMEKNSPALALKSL